MNQFIIDLVSSKIKILVVVVLALILSLNAGLLVASSEQTKQPATGSMAIAARPGSKGRLQKPAIQSSASSLGTVSYYNWSGYAATGQTFTHVEGQFKIPTITCTVPNAQTVFWVGFDGFANGTVEQSGVGALCSSDITQKPTYYAWWEMYPTNFITVLPLAVSPGNNVKASVSYAPYQKTYNLAVYNLSTGQSASKITKCATGLICARQSAEWIVERPSVNSIYTSLANWSTTTVTNSRATANGRLQPISAYAYSPINMIDIANTHNLAVVSPLQSYGQSFVDTWQAAN